MKAFPWRRRGTSQGWPRPQEPCPTPGRSELVDGQCPSAWVSCGSAITPRVPRSLCGPQGDPDVKTLDLYHTYTSLTPSPAWKAGPGGAGSSQRTVEGYIAYGTSGRAQRAEPTPVQAHGTRLPGNQPTVTALILQMRNRGPRGKAGELLEPRQVRAAPGCTLDPPWARQAALSPASSRGSCSLTSRARDSRGRGAQMSRLAEHRGQRALSWPHSQLTHLPLAKEPHF